MVSPKYGVGLLSLAGAALAQVTIYGQTPLAQTKTDGSWSAMTTLAAYNDTFLTPPAAPNPAANNNFALQLTKEAAQVEGISIAHNGPSFYGFSIEMSVITQIRECQAFVFFSAHLLYEEALAFAWKFLADVNK